MPMEFKVTNFDTPTLVGNFLVDHGDKVTVGMKPVMRSIFDDMLYASYKQMTSGGRRGAGGSGGGGSYKQLKEATIQKKGFDRFFYTSGAKPGYTKIGGDALVKSVTQFGRRFQIQEITEKTVSLGTNRPYAGTHQYGAPSRKIPARPFLSYTSRDVTKWNKRIEAHLMAGVKNT
jgi:Mu-like prophage protein gpG